MRMLKLDGSILTEVWAAPMVIHAGNSIEGTGVAGCCQWRRSNIRGKFPVG
jgi:hypothetical protein